MLYRATDSTLLPDAGVALCLITMSANMLFSAYYQPAALHSMARVTLATNGLLWLIVFMAIVSWADASDIVQIACSTFVTVLFFGTLALLRYIKNLEPLYALVAAILKHEPFKIEDFEAVKRTHRAIAEHKSTPQPLDTASKLSCAQVRTFTP